LNKARKRGEIEQRSSLSFKSLRCIFLPLNIDGLMKDSFLKQADEQIAKHHYREALDVLFSIWKSNPEAEIAEKILYCYRFTRRWDQHEKWLKIFKGKFPEQKFLHMEEKELILGKSLHEFLHSADAEEIDRKASEILQPDQFKPDELNIYFLMLVTRFKQLEKWELARKWVERIDSTFLSDKAKENKGTSPLKRYYLSKEDIYIELQEFDLILETFNDGRAVLGESLAIKKRLVKAMISANRLDEAQRFCEEQINWYKPVWFFVEHLAEIYLLKEELNLAWKYACIAFYTKGEQRHKLDLHLLLSKIAEKKGLKELAFDFKTLTILVRASEGQPLDKNLQEHLGLIKDPDVTVSTILKKHEQEILAGINDGLALHVGEIVWYPLDQNFARVKYDENKSTVVFKKDLADDCHYQGAKIDFYLYEHTDSKSGKKSTVAKYATKHFKLG
jgi:tetratricopeptide (TPR) repeat protein